MTILAVLLILFAACAALIILPMLLQMVFEALPLIIAIVIALCIYGWLT